MNKILLISGWEFKEKVRSRAFFISLIITPLILIIFTVGGTLLSGGNTYSTKIIGFIEPSGSYFTPVKNELEGHLLKGGQPSYLLVNLNTPGKSIDDSKTAADKMLAKKKIEGYILVKNANTDSLNVEYHSAASINISDIGNFTNAFNNARREIELMKYGLSRNVLKKISEETSIKYVQLNENGDKKNDFTSTFFTSVILIMMLMTLVVSTGGMLVRSLMEEKSNRLIDVIVSSCTPQQLLAGKIIGLSMLALFQMAIWLCVGLVLSGFSTFPGKSLQDILLLISYFLLGFFFYTSVFVGVGSVVSTEQGAQQVTSYLSILLVAPIILALPAIENPQMDLIQILSYIPFTCPTIMILRLNIAPVPLVEILTTIIIMILSVIIIINISGRLFRIGILITGTRPQVSDIMRWLREK